MINLSSDIEVLQDDDAKTISACRKPFFRRGRAKASSVRLASLKIFAGLWRRDSKARASESSDCPRLPAGLQSQREAYLNRLGIFKEQAKKSQKVGKSFSSASISHATSGEDSELVTPVKSQSDAFRTGFLRTLSYEGVWVPRAMRPRRTCETVIIFDWDDTLFPTTYVMTHATHVPPETLRPLTEAASQLLQAARKLGRTFIITNGAYGWVEDCTQNYMSDLLPALEGIPVISARHRFASRYHASHVSAWKVQAFLELQSSLSQDLITSFLSIGDSNYEKNAALTTGQVFPNAVIKTVKLVETPTPQELAAQLRLVYRELQKIVEKGEAFEVSLERRNVI